MNRFVGNRVPRPQECLLKVVDGVVACIRSDLAHQLAGHDTGPGGLLRGMSARALEEAVKRDLTCPVCGHYRDTPNHELGCGRS